MIAATIPMKWAAAFLNLHLFLRPQLPPRNFLPFVVTSNSSALMANVLILHGCVTEHGIVAVEKTSSIVTVERTRKFNLFNLL